MSVKLQPIGTPTGQEATCCSVFVVYNHDHYKGGGELEYRGLYILGDRLNEFIIFEILIEVYLFYIKYINVYSK